MRSFFAWRDDCRVSTLSVSAESSGTLDACLPFMTEVISLVGWPKPMVSSVPFHWLAMIQHVTYPINMYNMSYCGRLLLLVCLMYDYILNMHAETVYSLLSYQ